MAAANKGFASGGSNVSVRHFFVYLSFVVRSEFSAENPARTQSWANVKLSKNLSLYPQSLFHK